MIKEMIKKAADGIDLTYDEAAEVTREIMTGSTTPAQTAAYLTALHIKGETADEISASAFVMRDVATPVNYSGEVLEIVGTGGDGSNSINISTISALVCAAAGVKVAKHGNRAASSKCGTADCLEALGVNISTDPEGCVKLLDEAGMCFLFAQKYHSAMKYVGPVRKDIGIPTIFNVRGMAVFGTDKLDEISVSAPTMVLEFNGDDFNKYEITPEQFGIARHDKSELVGGTPDENAAAANRILSGEQGAGRDAVLLNAGAALHIVKGVSMEDGIKLAAQTIDSGAALSTLEKYIRVSNEVKA